MWRCSPRSRTSSCRCEGRGHRVGPRAATQGGGVRAARRRRPQWDLRLRLLSAQARRTPPAVKCAACCAATSPAPRPSSLHCPRGSAEIAGDGEGPATQGAWARTARGRDPHCPRPPPAPVPACEAAGARRGAVRRSRRSSLPRDALGRALGSAQGAERAPPAALRALRRRAAAALAASPPAALRRSLLLSCAWQRHRGERMTTRAACLRCCWRCSSRHARARYRPRRR